MDSNSHDRPKRTRFEHSNTNPLPLGCQSCPERTICGGIAIPGGVMDCLDLCCGKPETCTTVCKRNPNFTAYVQEVRGFSLDTIKHPYSARLRHLPVYVPHLYHGSSRDKVLLSPAVATCLSDLFSHKSGALRFDTKEALAQKLRFRVDAALAVIGVDEDQPIENYWSAGRSADLATQLKRLNPSLVSTPNYSLFNDVTRWDNLVNMKRIAITWEEFSSAGLPASLHLNARNDRDWERWAAFLKSYPEVHSVTFEFATGAKSTRRASWHVGHLVHLAKIVARPLNLVARGGTPYLAHLAEVFETLTFLDTNAFSKAVHRQKLLWAPGKRERWVNSPTAQGEPIDNLLQHNVDMSRALVAFSVPESKAIRENTAASSTG